MLSKLITWWLYSKIHYSPNFVGFSHFTKNVGTIWFWINSFSTFVWSKVDSCFCEAVCLTSVPMHFYFFLSNSRKIFQIRKNLVTQISGLILQRKQTQKTERGISGSINAQRNRFQTYIFLMESKIIKAFFNGSTNHSKEKVMQVNPSPKQATQSHISLHKTTKCLQKP